MSRSRGNIYCAVSAVNILLIGFISRFSVIKVNNRSAPVRHKKKTVLLLSARIKMRQQRPARKPVRGILFLNILNNNRSGKFVTLKGIIHRHGYFAFRKIITCPYAVGNFFTCKPALFNAKRRRGKLVYVSALIRVLYYKLRIVIHFYIGLYAFVRVEIFGSCAPFAAVFAVFYNNGSRLLIKMKCQRSVFPNVLKAGVRNAFGICRRYFDRKSEAKRR